MFFTKVVIDASNILALIFYNKITITVNGKNNVPYKPSIKPDRTGVPEKDFAGGIVGAFDPSKGLSEKTFKGAESSYLTLTNFALLAAAPSTGGLSLFYIGGGNKVNVGLFLSVIVVAAIIALLASYALLIASIAFMGRVIELWLCIIFSPFAFMSLAVPKLRGIEYLGWDAWIKRLLGVAFMAPIFMFFLLLITKIIQAPNSLNGLVDKDNPGMAGSIMLVVIPAIIYLSLLYKATEYAKKSSGDFAGAMIKGADTVIKGAAIGAGALGLAAATGGASLAATAALGKAGASVATRGVAMANKGGAFNKFLGRNLSTLGRGMQETEVNVRKIPGISNLAKKVGVKDSVGGFGKAMGWDTSGGMKGVKERQDKRALELQEHREKDDTKEEKRNFEIAKADLAEEKARVETGPEKADMDRKEVILNTEKTILENSTEKADMDRKEVILNTEKTILENSTEKAVVDQRELELKTAMHPIEADLEHIDKGIEKLDKELMRAKNAGNNTEVTRISTEIENAKRVRKLKRDSVSIVDASGVTVRGADALEKNVRDAKTAYNTKSSRLRTFESDFNDAKKVYETRRATHLRTFESDFNDAKRVYETRRATLQPLEARVADTQREFSKKASESAIEFAGELTSFMNKKWNLFRRLGLYDEGQADATARKIRQKAGQIGGENK